MPKKTRDGKRDKQSALEVLRRASEALRADIAKDLPPGYEIKTYGETRVFDSEAEMYEAIVGRPSSVIGVPAHLVNKLTKPAGSP